jgi:hypothetical protein
MCKFVEMTLARSGAHGYPGLYKWNTGTRGYMSTYQNGLREPEREGFFGLVFVLGHPT